MRRSTQCCIAVAPAMSNKFNMCKLLLSVLLTLESRMQKINIVLCYRNGVCKLRYGERSTCLAPASRTNIITITNVQCPSMLLLPTANQYCYCCHCCYMNILDII